VNAKEVAQREQARDKLGPVRLVTPPDLEDKFPQGNHQIQHACPKNVPRSS
jgi:hypothetical protein